MSALILKVKPRTTAGWTPERPHKIGFMRLPSETRHKIYEFALVEPARWEKKHELCCFVRTHKATDADPPPFMLMNVEIFNDPVRIVTKCLCNCGKRKCLGLLAANRLIHDEAAPLFWSCNAFCFLSWPEVVTVLRYMLRPKYRGMVRELSLMSPCVFAFSDHVVIKHDYEYDISAFWDVIAECSGLAKLQIPGSVAGLNYWIVQSAVSMLPNVSIEFVVFVAFCKFERELGFNGPWVADREHLPEHHATVYAKVVIPIDHVAHLKKHPIENIWSEEGLKSVRLGYDVEDHLKLDFFGMDDSDMGNGMDSYHIPDGLDEDHTRCTLVLDDGRSVNVEFYGLPVSRKTALLAASAKRAEDEKQRAINGLTVAQNEASKRSRQYKRVIRRENQSRKAAASSRTHRYDVADPGYAGTWPSFEERRKKRERAVAKLQKKSEEENKKTRKMERKRVRPGVKKADSHNLLL
ncbi:hypothetical protein EsH8_II_000583 [Colletotrichum jinshuiense]